MLSYESQVTNKTGTFPSCLAKNASSGGGTDGTEYVASWINEDWGFWQALLSAATMTPNGVAEVYNASQKLQAMKMLFGAPGEIVLDDIPPAGTYGAVTISYPGTGPNGRQDSSYQYRRVLACAGQVLTVANYPDLANAIYPGDANNAAAPSGYRTTSLGSPSANRSTSGQYFVMPDYRGLTIRGYDPALVRDPGGATRGLLASIQLDAFQGHVHAPPGIGFVYAASGPPNITYGAGATYNFQVGGTTGSPVNDGPDGTPRTTTETRMVNATCNIGMRY